MTAPSSGATPEIMLVAGEASGDLHGASLIQALKNRNFKANFVAMGGEKIRSTGAKIIVDNRKMAVIGIIEVLRQYPYLRRTLNQLKDYLEQSPPDLLVLIDYVEFNLKLAQHAKTLGIKVLFYISPQVWAWRQGRGKKIAANIDMMAVIFPFEVDYYQKLKVPVRYVGNPLVGKVKASADKPTNQARFKLNPNQPVIGLQPGSRKSEIARLLPIFLKTADLLQQQLPTLQFILPVAATIDRPSIEAQIPPQLKIVITQDDLPYDTMQVCDVILTASGTATLETALMKVPMVVTYRVAPVTYLLLKRLIKIPNIALANIVAGRRVVAEFVQDAAQPPALSTELLRILKDQSYTEEIVTGLQEVKDKLGDLNGSAEMAKLVSQILTDSCPELNAIG